MRWERTGREVKANGESTTTYISHNPEGWMIESRKKAIPHAGGRSGYWMHTTYFLLCGDGTEKEYYSLRDAKEAAEMNLEPLMERSRK